MEEDDHVCVCVEILREELGDESKLESVLENLSTESVPQGNVLMSMVGLLLHPESQVQHLVKQYFTALAKTPSRRLQVRLSSSATIQPISSLFQQNSQ